MFFPYTHPPQSIPSFFSVILIKLHCKKKRKKDRKKMGGRVKQPEDFLSPYYPSLEPVQEN